MSADVLDRIILKAKRAKGHISDLESACDEFFRTCPYQIRGETDPNQRERTYYITGVRDAPWQIAAITGDEVQNLRSALDHLAHHLVILGTGKPGPFTNVYFPISESASEMEADIARKIRGARNEALDAIRALKPYKGGHHTLWRLHKLNNIDKHRFVLTVGSTHLAHTMTSSEREKILHIYRGSHPGQPDPDLTRVLMHAASVRMLQCGDVLLRIPEAEVQQTMNFHLDLAFNEPGIVDCEPIVAKLNEMAIDVIDIITGFSKAGLL